MQAITPRHRRLATFLLGLFLSLLAMVTLHDFSHRAKVVPCATTVQCDSSAGGDQQTISTAHSPQVTCALCQFVHTPFVALTASITLAALLLHLCLLLTRECSSSLRLARISPQLRAPPTFA